ncbi:SDR family NAD(P)-dependent oxidoreductase [Mesorhizobium sp. CAU 1741]|uniref:SDR family NAD(P)-dependent oxidoreductase n=1 Tax=Mesorhizobium sp. CAU 1741 TaxID=3140366 RepID=UPI00325A46E7
MNARVSVVTGAGQGIGRAIALRLAQRGDHVAIAELDATAAERVATEIRTAGGSASAHETDVVESASVDAAMNAIATRWGPPLILVNSARWTQLKPTPLREITDADWRKAMDVNVTGAFHCARAASRFMVEAGWGRIVNLSSSTIHRPPGRPYVHYITTKAALVGMTRALARELGVAGITVNVILPGSIETEVTRHITTEERERRARATQAIPRVIKTEDVVEAVVFLTGDGSDFITGQSLAVDGGFSFS